MDEDLTQPLPPKFPALVPGTLYRIAPKNGVLYLSRQTEEGKNVHRRVRTSEGASFLLVKLELIEDKKIWRTFITRKYHFLFDGYVWYYLVHQQDDTTSEWLKPVTEFVRFNPAKRKVKNYGTLYPGPKSKPSGSKDV